MRVRIIVASAMGHPLARNWRRKYYNAFSNLDIATRVF